MNSRIVSHSWVYGHLSSISVVDVRDPWEYAGIGHLPTAVNIPFDTFRAESSGEAEAGYLPGANVFSSLLSEVGVDADHHILAYDDMHGVFAARFLVTAELYGHDPNRLHLLNGDFSSWQQSYEVTSSQPDFVPIDHYPAEFSMTGPIVSYAEVKEALDSDVLFLDVRRTEEFQEGHIPGAVQLNWMDLIDESSRRLLDETRLLEILEERGITTDRKILLYCNTARRISHTYIVLRSLGYDKLAFYEGSITEWIDQDEELSH